MAKRKPSLAVEVGSGLALIQHGIDTIFLWGFRKAQAIGDSEKTSATEFQNPYLRRVEKLGRGALSLIGEMGDSYYDTYGRLKKKKK